MRSSTDTATRARTERRTLIFAAAAVGATTLLVAGCSATSDSVESGQGATAAPPVSLAGSVNDHGEKDITGDGATSTLELELDDSYFGPTYVKAAPGAVVKVELKNEGSKVHTFTLDGETIDVTVDPGSSAQVDVTMPDSGNVHYFCKFHTGAGMQGSFVVTGPAAAAGSPTTPAPTTVATTAGGGYRGY